MRVAACLADLTPRTMPADKQEILRPKLEEAQRALDAALEEACSTDIHGADTTDLMQLEETLTVARQAAQKVLDMLRRLPHEQREPNEIPAETHRTFVDARGVEWDAFAVRPSRATEARGTLPGSYAGGWLAFQCPEEVRRVTPIPEGWRECSHEEFGQLLESAQVAPRRRR